MSSDGHLEEKRSRPSTAATAAAVPEKEKGEESPVVEAKKGFFGRKKKAPVVEEEKPDAIEIAAGKADKVPPVGFTQLFRYAHSTNLFIYTNANICPAIRPSSS